MTSTPRYIFEFVPYHTRTCDSRYIVYIINELATALPTRLLDIGTGFTRLMLARTATDGTVLESVYIQGVALTFCLFRISGLSYPRFGLLSSFCRSSPRRRTPVRRHLVAAS